jgi:transposase
MLPAVLRLASAEEMEHAQHALQQHHEQQHQHQHQPFEPAGPKQQKRAQLSASIKQDLCEYKRQNPSTTQEQIADYVYQKFSIKINRSTVAKILKQCDKWLSLDVSDAAQANKKRMRAAKHQGLEAGLYDWYDQVRPIALPTRMPRPRGRSRRQPRRRAAAGPRDADPHCGLARPRASPAPQQEAQQGIRPTDNQVIARAIEMAQGQGIQDSEFKASQGWLANFKKRYNIKPRHPMADQGAQIHLMQHPQGVPVEALQHAEAHAALAQAHMLPPGAELSFQAHLQQLHHYRPMMQHAAQMEQTAAIPELVPESDQDISNQTAHLCAQRVGRPAPPSRTRAASSAAGALAPGWWRGLAPPEPLSLAGRRRRPQRPAACEVAVASASAAALHPPAACCASHALAPPP